MGSAASSTSYDLHDWSHERNVSVEHRISEWTNLGTKNLSYYDGERFFKVSRSLYPSYTKGWIYGYYDEDSDYWWDRYCELESD